MILKHKSALCAVLILAVAAAFFIFKTQADLMPLPVSLNPGTEGVRKALFFDRRGHPLTATYQNRWNVHDTLPLHEIPPFLRQAFLISEDRRFFSHHGVDWIARCHALAGNLFSLRVVRGASTISEQVIRMHHPRPRTLWSKWLEGLEAQRLERRFSKREILEFYLNQVPYVGRRRGILQAARHYFGRDPATLNRAEMLELVVMVRAPSHLDIFRRPKRVRKLVMQLGKRLVENEVLDAAEFHRMENTSPRVRTSADAVEAGCFVRFVSNRHSSDVKRRARVWTTLDGTLQKRVQDILNTRLAGLGERGAANGAVLVVDNRNGEVLSWTTAAWPTPTFETGGIDPVIVPRQPGSALKPFLYAIALEKGWTAATMLEDAPLSEPVGTGQHAYHNYSRIHYGAVRLREALGNSLNIPAVRAIRFVGVDTFLERLHMLGIESLTRHPDHYGDGLALGNGEISLFELVGAYCTLANRGIYRPLKMIRDMPEKAGVYRRIFSEEIAAIIGDILSDPMARMLEFGGGSLLRLPVQTAVKTGTSSDYRDAWTVGYTDRYTVGVWMGNLAGKPMEGVSGSAGPALVLRSVFAELNRNHETRSLPMSPHLVRQDVCGDSGRAADSFCPRVSEWFVRGTEPAAETAPKDPIPESIRFTQPSPGLHLAMDPRIPDEEEAFLFALSKDSPAMRVQWFVDGQRLAETAGGRFLWPLSPGRHHVTAAVSDPAVGREVTVPEVAFVVR